MSLLREACVLDFRKRYNLQAFVETGCGWNADGLIYARDNLGFTTLYTCDLIEKLVKTASEYVPNATVLHMSSKEFLLKIMPEISNVPTMFWLDAHLPQNYEPGKYDVALKFPLDDELEILSSKPGIENDVILIDDYKTLYLNGMEMQYFTDTHRWDIIDEATQVLRFMPKDK